MNWVKPDANTRIRRVEVKMKQSLEIRIAPSCVFNYSYFASYAISVVIGIQSKIDAEFHSLILKCAKLIFDVTNYDLMLMANNVSYPKEIFIGNRVSVIALMPFSVVVTSIISCKKLGVEVHGRKTKLVAVAVCLVVLYGAFLYLFRDDPNSGSRLLRAVIGRSSISQVAFDALLPPLAAATAVFLFKVIRPTKAAP